MLPTPLTRSRPPLKAWLGAGAAALLLSACGGGGGGGGGNSTTSGVSGSVTLSGVVATGAPLIGATVSVVDAQARSCGSGTTSLADGSYTLTLTCSSPRMPLLIEAIGPDMSGAPVTVHSLLQSVTTGTGTRNIANINSLTNAVVALLLGGDPATHFQNASTSYSQWTLLSSSTALAAANAFIKTVVRTNLNDAHLTNAATVDFFGDPNFSANKTGLDIALEGLNIGFSKDNSNNELLQLSNRLLPPCDPSAACSTTNKGSPEVVVNLSTAKSNLAGATPTVAAGATVSSIKATTSLSTPMGNLAGLETLRTVVNLAMLQAGNAATFATTDVSTGKPVFGSSFGYYNGATALDLAGTLVGYGAQGYQLSSLQIKGCMDYPLPTNGCSKMKVVALVRDGASVVQLFETGVSYTAGTGWNLVGNGRQTSWDIYPVTWLELDSVGRPSSAPSSHTANTGQGIQVVVRALDYMIADLTFPSGHAVRFSYCSTVPLDPLCLASVETGDLVKDQVVITSGSGWIGAYDTRPGARYQISTSTLSSGSESNSTLLMADLPPTTPTSAYPMMDGWTLDTTGTGSNAQLTITNFTSGLTVSWNTWAAAHPGLRMIEVRGVIKSTTSALIRNVVKVNPLSANSVTLPVISTVPNDAQTFTLWLVAQDGLGRRYITKIAAS